MASTRFLLNTSELLVTARYHGTRPQTPSLAFSVSPQCARETFKWNPGEEVSFTVSDSCPQKSTGTQGPLFPTPVSHMVLSGHLQRQLQNYLALFFSHCPAAHLLPCGSGNEHSFWSKAWYQDVPCVCMCVYCVCTCVCKYVRVFHPS